MNCNRTKNGDCCCVFSFSGRFVVAEGEGEMMGASVNDANEDRTERENRIPDRTVDEDGGGTLLADKSAG